MIGELTNHLWQSTVFAVVAGLLTVAFRKNRAQVRYWLWLSASFKFLVPFSLLMSLGSRLEWAPVTASDARRRLSRFTMVQISQPFPERLAADARPRRAASRLGQPSRSSACGRVDSRAIALMRFRGWRRIRAAVRSSTPHRHSGTMQVRSSPGLLEPGVVGLFRPILLLPAGIVERLQPRSIGGGACARAVPRPATRQLNFRAST